MNYKVGVISLPLLFLVGCAINNSNLQTVVDPSYNFIFENNNKIAQDSFINFKVSSVKNGLITGYIINNIFNVNSDVVLFKSGDKITVNYSKLDSACSYNNADLYNYKNEDTSLNGFVFMNGENIFNCDTKSGFIGLKPESEIYTLKVLTSNSLPVLNGVAAPDLFKQSKDSIYSLYKVVTPSDKITWLPTNVMDNGIQTYIELNSISAIKSNKDSKLLVYNNLGGHKALHTNYSFVKNGIMIDGVYNNISLIYLSGDANQGEVSILRGNIPNTTNSLVNKLYQMKDGFYKQDNINQQGSVVSVYQQNNQSTNSVVSGYNQQNQSKYNDDLVIAKANLIQNQQSANGQTQQNMNYSNQSPAPVNKNVLSSNSSVPPISGNQVVTKIYSADAAPSVAAGTDNNQGDINNQANQDSSNNGGNYGMGISVMKQLGF